MAGQRDRDLVLVPSTALLVPGVDPGEAEAMTRMRSSLAGLLHGTHPTVFLGGEAPQEPCVVGIGGTGIALGARIADGRLEPLAGEAFLRADPTPLAWPDATLLTILAHIGVTHVRLASPWDEYDDEPGPFVAAFDLCPDDRPDSPVPFDATSAAVNDACRAALETGDAPALVRLAPRVARSGGSVVAGTWVTGPARIVDDIGPAGVRYLLAVGPGPRAGRALAERPGGSRLDDRAREAAQGLESEAAPSRACGS